MNKKLKTDKKDARMVREEGVAYRAAAHSEEYNDYSHAGEHTSSASSRTAEFVNEIVKSIMNNMENTAFDKLNEKIDAVDAKVDAVDIKIDTVDIKIESLDKDNKNLEKLMDTKVEDLNSRFDALEEDNKNLEKLMNAKFEAADKLNNLKFTILFGLMLVVPASILWAVASAIITKLFGG